MGEEEGGEMEKGAKKIKEVLASYCSTRQPWGTSVAIARVKKILDKCACHVFGRQF